MYLETKLNYNFSGLFTNKDMIKIISKYDALGYMSCVEKTINSRIEDGKIETWLHYVITFDGKDILSLEYYKDRSISICILANRLDESLNQPALNAYYLVSKLSSNDTRFTLQGFEDIVYFIVCAQMGW